MKIIKIYETVINLSANEMYSNIDIIIMDKLRQRFEGKCEKNSLITKILGIEKRSKCQLAKSRLDGSGDVNVQFKSEAVIYNDDDILTGCEVQRIKRGNKIICKHDIAVVNIKGNRNLQSLKPGQKINIRISSVSYLKGRDKITVYGVPYSYSYKFIIYSTIIDVSKISLENIEILKKKLQEIDNEYKLYEQSDQKSVKFFNDVYYPFKESFEDMKKTLKNSKILLIDVYDLTKKLINYATNKSETNIFLIRHPIIDKSTPIIFKIEESDLKSGISGDLLNPTSYEIEIVKENITFVLLNFLNDYLSHIKVIREMTEIYITETDIESNSNIWGIYNRLKK